MKVAPFHTRKAPRNMGGPGTRQARYTGSPTTDCQHNLLPHTQKHRPILHQLRCHLPRGYLQFHRHLHSPGLTYPVNDHWVSRSPYVYPVTPLQLIHPFLHPLRFQDPCNHHIPRPAVLHLMVPHDPRTDHSRHIPYQVILKYRVCGPLLHPSDPPQHLVSRMHRPHDRRDHP